MNTRVAITVLRERDEVARLWKNPAYGTAASREVGAAVVFKDALRRFKQRVETGEVPRSDGSPEGERAERKVRQRPAQPLAESELAELEKAGVS